MDSLAPEIGKGTPDGQRQESNLVHGVFCPPSVVLAASKARCAEKDIDFGKFTWVGSELAPEFDPNDPETVVVLDATLGTLQETFEFACEWAIAGQKGGWRSSVLRSSPGNLALLDGIEFQPWTLRWVRIKLDANVGRKPVDVRNPKLSPGCALLFMCAQHPERIKAMDYKKRFGFYLPGLKCKEPGYLGWPGVPCVIFNGKERFVELFADPYDSCHEALAVPVLEE